MHLNLTCKIRGNLRFKDELRAVLNVITVSRGIENVLPVPSHR